MLVLGANEFLAVLYNPLWLILGLLIFLFIKSVYQVGWRWIASDRLVTLRLLFMA